MLKDSEVALHRKRFIRISMLIFAVIGIIHALRIGYEWQITFSSYAVPIYVSWLVVFVALLMLIMGAAYLKR